MYDSLSDSFVFNQMACIYEKYAYKLQQSYRDEICVNNKLEENDFGISGRQQYIESLNEQVHYFVKKDSFEEKMKKYCEGKLSPLAFNVIEENDERIKAYYNELGAERIKALGYKESALRNEVSLRAKERDIKIALSQVFYSGIRMSTADIKRKLADVYKRVGVNKKAVAKDLEKYGYKLKQVKVTVNEERKNGFEIE